MERDDDPSFKATVMVNFNSHAHVERDGRIAKQLYPESDFNSHAHVERDCDLATTPSPFLISTHTLTWSVTSRLAY